MSRGIGRGMVPGLPFGRVVSEWLERQNFQIGEDNITIAPLQWLADEMNTDVENVRKLKNGKRSWISFDTADKVVVMCVGPFGWWLDAELAKIYQTVDLGFIDRAKPCTRLAA